METVRKANRVIQGIKSVAILFCILFFASCVMPQQSLQQGGTPSPSLSPPESESAQTAEKSSEIMAPAAGENGEPRPAASPEPAAKPTLAASKAKRIVPSSSQKRKVGQKGTAGFSIGHMVSGLLNKENLSLGRYEKAEAASAVRQTEAEHAPEAETVTQPENTSGVTLAPEAAMGEPKSGLPSEKYKEYKAVLAADPTIIVPGPPGRLRVWIGIPDYEPDFPINMEQASGLLPALGSQAKITPYAPAFKIEPKNGGCIRIDPSGSEIGFSLTPLREEDGTFDVGADVQLYDTDDCSGIPIPKATTTVQVQVVVKHVKKFYEVFWEMLLKFWGEFLLLLAAVILFLIRKQLKKWIGFDTEG